MKHIKNSIVVLACMLAVTGLVTFFVPSLTQGQPGGPPTQLPPVQSVKVVNSPSEAVPVTGAVNVGNVVQVRPTLQPGAFSVVPFGTNLPVISGPDPEGTNYAITSITVINDDTDSGFVRMAGHWGSSCDSGITVLGPGVVVPARETVHIPYPQPFIFSAHPGAVSCLKVSESSASTQVTVIGYRF